LALNGSQTWVAMETLVDVIGGGSQLAVQVWRNLGHGLSNGAGSKIEFGQFTRQK
jgi:hypothetical protein